MTFAHFIVGLIGLTSGTTIPSYSLQQICSESTKPPPPARESIVISRLSLPPVTPDDSEGACSKKINSRGTGCMIRSEGLQGFQAGNFLPDDKHVVATIRFGGAPSEPDSSSIYDGLQVIVIKADGSVFPNGDAWICLTCGVAAGNDHSPSTTDRDYSYPQVFADGKRVLAGSYIVDCGGQDLTSPECTADKTSIYPIRFENTTDGSGPGAAIRELRLHPDQVHLGFNAFDYLSGKLGQFAYIGRLVFDPAPKSGLPLEPRYDLVDVNVLFNPEARPPIYANGSELRLNHNAITVGERRGFSGTGREVTYIGYPTESCNIDVYAADLYTGKVRRLTAHPGYVDPIQMAPDDGSIVIMDTRGSGRTEFMDGMRGIPAVSDLITTTACSSIRNNGARRFFQPWLLDRYGDRGEYYGQEINSASFGTAGSGDFDDPEWNGMADPWFSNDGTRIVYWQAQTVSPACGNAGQTPCYNSTEPGGQAERILIAHLTDRRPLPKRNVTILPDTIPWATKYIPGADLGSVAPTLAGGNYTLQGEFSGVANVEVVTGVNNASIQAINVNYDNFSDDGLGIIDGFQNISVQVEGLTNNFLHWFSDLVRTGKWSGIQRTGPDGFNMSIDALTNFFEANGTLTTTVDGVVFRQPANGQ